jgi:hypothetical protein
MNESNVKEAVKKALTAVGAFYWMPAANGYGKSGVSDIIALRDGRMAAIEAKYNSHKATPLQIKFLDNVRAQGMHGVVVSDTNYPETMYGTLAYLGVDPLDAAAVVNRTHPIRERRGKFKL